MIHLEDTEVSKNQVNLHFHTEDGDEAVSILLTRKDAYEAGLDILKALREYKEKL